MSFENEAEGFNSSAEENIPITNEASLEGVPSFEAQSAESAPCALTYPYPPFPDKKPADPERKGIRKSALLIGAAVLFIFAFSELWPTLFYFVASLFGFDKYSAYTFLTEPAVLNVAQIILSSVMFIFPFAICAPASRIRVSELIPFSKPKSGTALPLTIIGVGFCAFSNIAVSQISAVFEAFGFSYDMPTNENPEGFFGFFLAIISTAIVPALVEEFACRGIMFGLLKKYGESFAVITTSLIFGLIHGNFAQMPFAFLAGLILGYIRLKTDSLWIVCLVHGINNLISVLISYLSPFLPSTAVNMLYVVILLSLLVIGIVGVGILSYRMGTNALAVKESGTAALEKTKYSWFFTSPIIIICIIAYMLKAVIYLFV